MNRAAPTADDILLFDGTGLAPVGEAISVNDSFINLLPQTVEGLDIGMQWRLRGTPWGDFRASLNAAHLMEFNRSPGPLVQSLFEAREQGLINENTPLPISETLLARNGRPEWRVGLADVVAGPLAGRRLHPVHQLGHRNGLPQHRGRRLDGRQPADRQSVRPV